MTARPFPWSSLDVVTRQDMTATRAMRAWGASFAREAVIAGAASELSRSRVSVRVKSVRSARQGSRTTRSDADLGVLLGVDGLDLSRAILIEAEAALATALLGRSIRRAVPRVVDPSVAVTAGVAGAFSAVVVAIARRAHGTFAPHVIASGPARVLARDLESRGGDLLEATLTVIVDDDAYVARALLPRSAAMAAGEAPWTRATLAHLGDAPLALGIVAAVSRSTVTEVGTLRRGDAWIPGAFPPRTRTAAGGIAGPVLLAASSHETGFRADLGEDGRLVLGAGVESLAWSAESGESMSEALNESDSNALVDAVGEVPVVVRVEIGLAEMRAREWASLGPGDVIALGRKIGDGVTLRVGGVAVARGELVDLEGEVGVRIVGRAEGR